MSNRPRALCALTALASVLSLPASAVAGTQYQYDALGRLTRVTYETGVVVQYSYDAAGNRSQVTTSGVNRPPIASNDGASVLTSATVDIPARANDSDPDGDALTITSVGPVSGGGSVSIEGGGAYLRYVAPATAGTKSFTYTISDGRGGTASATVTVNVGMANRSPVAVNDGAGVNVSSIVDILVRANDSDPDGDALTVTAVSTPSGGGTTTVEGGGTHVRYAAPSTAGTRTFGYTISDGRGGTASATVTVNVIQPNRPPVAVNDSGIEVERYTTSSIYPLANDSDPDGDPLVITGANVTSGGGSVAVVSGGGYLRYTTGGVGDVDLQYTISDGRGGTATASVTVFVTRTFPLAGDVDPDVAPQKRTGAAPSDSVPGE